MSFKTTAKALVASFLTLSLISCGSPAPLRTSETLLLEGWKFHLGAAEGAQTAAFDDSEWQSVTIPHDWAIGGPFDKDIDKQVVAITQNGEDVAQEKTGRTGSLPWIGEGWYRCSITIPEGYARAELVFDGAMAEPHVWVAGEDVGYWAYGYNAFVLDITEATKGCAAGTYPVAVHLQNIEESSRWYPGAGIYRPVRLVLHPENHIKTWGVFARTKSISDGEALVAVSLDIDSKLPYEVANTVIDADGKVVASSKGADNQLICVKNPQLWSPESPYLYTLRTELLAGGTVADMKETRLGIRTISYTAEGFALNGEVRKFKGVCLHHDLGPLGAAFNKAAFARQIRLLKEIGCDAIRTSHNTPAPWQLDLCDELGMMVMAESFDMWVWPKCKNGYSRFFEEWWERDIENMVRYSRSHPSVVMYSIGNEIPEQSSELGLKYTRLMQAKIASLDPTRPCTQGMDHGTGAIESGVWAETQIPGMNYRLYVYHEGHKNSPKGIVLGSETASTVSSRGVYHFPVEETYSKDFADGQCSGYDVEACIWSNLPEDDWMYQDKMSWVIGEFVWTGFDYLGEPTPYDHYWPSRSSYFGIYDLAGLPKDRAYLYKIHWKPDEASLHVLPHWNWDGREGEVTPVYAYTTWPEAELFVNGVSQGRIAKTDVSMEEYLANRYDKELPWRGTALFPDPDMPREKNRLDRYRLRWNDVVYAPGEIKVVAYDASGAVADTRIIRTAGEPHHIELVADKSSLVAVPVGPDGRAIDCPDMAFVTARIVDKDGNLCPTATNRLSFEVQGAASFNSCCNGDATSLESFTNPSMEAFGGQLVVVLQAGKTSGPATLTVHSDSLPDAKIKVRVK